MRKISLFLLALLAALALPVHAAWPEKPVRIIISFPPGGTSDLIARAVADPLAKALGQQVLLDYKPGGDGVIAADAVAHAAPDGYTLLLAQSNALTYAPATHNSMPYDAQKDFTPVAGIGNVGFFLYVHPSVPARDVRELAAYIRGHEGTVSHGASTPMSLLASTAWARGEGLQLTEIPYKGDAPLILDLLAGRVQLAIAAGGLLTHAQSGKLRMLASLSSTRNPLLPDVPTLKEADGVDVAIRAWTGIVGPAGLPAEVVDRLARACSEVMAQPEVRQRLAALAFEPVFSDPQAFATIMQVQSREWRSAIRSAGSTGR